MKKLLIGLILALAFTFAIPQIHATEIKGNFLDIVTKGPWIDVRAYATVTLANTAAYSTGKTLLITQECILPASTTLTASVMVIKGGSFTHVHPFTLTINGPFEAGLYQVFSGFSAGDVTFGPGAVKEVYPEWWGNNTTPGTTDMILPITYAIGSITSTSAMIVKFSPCAYKITTPILIDRDYTTLDLNGGAIYQATINTDAIQIAKATGGATARNRVTIKNGYVIGGTVSGSAINAEECHHLRLENLGLWAGDTSGKGIHIKTCYYTVMDKIIISVNYTAPYGLTPPGSEIGYDGIYCDGQNDTVSIMNFDITGLKRDAISIPGPTSNTHFNIGAGRYDGSGRYGFYASHLFDSKIYNISGEANTTKDIYIDASGRCELRNLGGDKGLEFGAANHSMQSFNLFFGCDAAYIIGTGYDNSFTDCAQAGNTLPTDNGTRTRWVNFFNYTWPPVTLISSRKGVQINITAFATGGQANAVALIADICEISVCATAGDSVKLPVAAPGFQIIIINHGIASCNVFPNTSDAINEAAPDAAKTLAADASMICNSWDTTNWECLTLAR
jgi:hypothetical protein